MYAGYVVRFSIGAPSPTTVVSGVWIDGGRVGIEATLLLPVADVPIRLDFLTKPTQSGSGELYMRVLVGRSVEILVKRLSCDFGAINPSCFDFIIFTPGGGRSASAVSSQVLMLLFC